MTYCTQCGTMNPDYAVFCKKCGAQLSAQNTTQPQSTPTAQSTPTVNNYYYGRQRRRDRAGSGGRGGSAIAPFIFAAIFIVIGMAVFFPNLQWQWFWGVLWLVIAGLIVGFWASRHSQGKAPQPQQTMS